jgi:TetR/AcrR family transcriptional regulator, transcriptional repressor for nem operon
MKREETQNHILDTAIELFWRQSYHGVNMNALSAAAGLNKATVYQHFTSKEALAVAAVKRATARTEEYAYRGAFEESDDAKARLIWIYDRSYQIQADIFANEGRCRGCPFVNIGIELASTSQDIRRSVAAAFDMFATYYSRIVATLPKPQDGVDDKELVAALVANMNGAIVAAKIENRPEAILDGKARVYRFMSFETHAASA